MTEKLKPCERCGKEISDSAPVPFCSKECSIIDSLQAEVDVQSEVKRKDHIYMGELRERVKAAEKRVAELEEENINAKDYMVKLSATVTTLKKRIAELESELLAVENYQEELRVLRAERQWVSVEIKVKRGLDSWRSQHQKDENGDGLELTDLLSPFTTVKEGLEEKQSILESILIECCPLPSPPKEG